MSAGVVGVLAEALAEHRWRSLEWCCKCGDTAVSVQEWPAHVASVVAALPNIAVVELPGSDSHGRWRSERWGVRDDGWLKWSVGTDADGILFASARRGEGKPMNMAAEFEAFAAALLAAARAARAAGGQA